MSIFMDRELQLAPEPLVFSMPSPPLAQIHPTTR